jgi:hypothetical protein
VVAEFKVSGRVHATWQAQDHVCGEGLHSGVVAEFRVSGRFEFRDRHKTTYAVKAFSGVVAEFRVSGRFEFRVLQNLFVHL